MDTKKCILIVLIIYLIFFFFFSVDLTEINILWAAHSVHHSSEEYNLTTALRQSALQGPTGWMFYLPGALFIPPPVWAVHRQFNVSISTSISNTCVLI